MANEPTDPPVKMADEVAERVVAALTPRFDAIDARFEAVETRIDKGKDELKGEIQAVREVVDTLAS